MNKEDVKLDQFYTNDDVVDSCISIIEFDDYDIIIEPSAGDGAFYNKITGEKIGIDLDPKVDCLIHYHLTYHHHLYILLLILVF